CFILSHISFYLIFFFFSSRRRHTRWPRDWSSDVCSSDLPAFRDEEVALLAPRLADALSQARPNEIVTYYLSQPQTSIKREITSGGLYVKQNDLHFILGNRRIIYGIPAYGMVYDRRYPTRPTAAKGFDLVFDPSSAVVKQESSILDRWLGLEKDEMVINLQQIAPSQPVTAHT